ncbi:hypothetical protein LY76DRAFT_112047 [Colletotrichum caudatum]|nr:hypothetical protein LY76DRAFT_112047 [Colletotrichum caudatum]
MVRRQQALTATCCEICLLRPSSTLANDTNIGTAASCPSRIVSCRSVASCCVVSCIVSYRIVSSRLVLPSLISTTQCVQRSLIPSLVVACRVLPRGFCVPARPSASQLPCTDNKVSFVCIPCSRRHDLNLCKRPRRRQSTATTVSVLPSSPLPSGPLIL